MSLSATIIRPVLPRVCNTQIRIGDDPTILTDIYADGAHLAVWKRDLSNALIKAADQILEIMPALKVTCTVTPESAYRALFDMLNQTNAAATLSADIAQLVDMFCFMFDLKRAGLRISALNYAMCSRFHVDKVPCRLISTYRGVGTEWLPHSLVDRDKLEAGNNGKPDEVSGLYKSETDIQQLEQGDVALLKGEGWEHNKGAGLVHRSPRVPNGASRLLVTLDFIYE